MRSANGRLNPLAEPITEDKAAQAALRASDLRGVDVRLRDQVEKIRKGIEADTSDDIDDVAVAGLSQIRHGVVAVAARKVTGKSQNHLDPLIRDAALAGCKNRVFLQAELFGTSGVKSQRVVAFVRLRDAQSDLLGEHRIETGLLQRTDEVD